MKTIRIELRVTAVVHIGEDLSETESPPPDVARCSEEISIRRVVPLGWSLANPAESSNIYATTKAHAVSAIAGIAGVLPEKLGHGARELTL